MTIKRFNEEIELNDLTEFEKLFPVEMVKAARQAASEGRLLNIKTDIGFKLFLCHDSEASRYCLKSIITAFTGQEVKNFLIKNTEILPEYIKSKNCRLDVLVEFNDGQTIDMELQLKCEDDEERKRSAFYASKLYSSKLTEGKNYSEINNVFQVFIVDFNIFDDNKNFHQFTFRDNTGIEFTDSIQLITLELPKLKKLPFDSTLNKAEFWGKIISEFRKIHDRQIVIPGYEEELKMIQEATNEIANNEREWLIQMARESSMIETHVANYYANKRGFEKGLQEGRQVGLQQGLQEGLQQGLQEGNEKGKLEAAIIAVKELNISAETAAEKFNIPLEKLLQSLNS